MAMNTKSYLAIVLVVGLFALSHVDARAGKAHIHARAAPRDKKHEFLTAHNIERAQEHLSPLTWNNTLAEFAQSFVQKRAGDCQLIHSDDDLYGENLAMSGGEETPAEAVTRWCAEKANYDHESNKCTQGNMCGHYTQVMWKDTTSVGCASVNCATGGTFISCNYYPPGNFVGAKPF